MCLQHILNRKDQSVHSTVLTGRTNLFTAHS